VLPRIAAERPACSQPVWLSGGGLGAVKRPGKLGRAARRHAMHCCCFAIGKLSGSRVRVRRVWQLYLLYVMLIQEW
jgi:hypothetical protein